MKKTKDTGNIFPPTPKKIELLTKAQAACEEFTDFLDNLFYEGYAQQLATGNPQDFNEQFSNYLNSYSHV